MPLCASLQSECGHDIGCLAVGRWEISYYPTAARGGREWLPGYVVDYGGDNAGVVKCRSSKRRLRVTQRESSIRHPARLATLAEAYRLLGSRVFETPH